jgi:hypothetical protein
MRLGLLPAAAMTVGWTMSVGMGSLWKDSTNFELRTSKNGTALAATL